MKRTIIITILGLFLVCGLKVKAQTITLPTFTEDMVVMKITHWNAQYTSYLTISDGLSDAFCAELKVEPITMKKEKEESNIPALANIFNQLKKQGYKIITSTTTYAGTSSFAITNYIFQKE